MKNVKILMATLIVLVFCLTVGCWDTTNPNDIKNDPDKTEQVVVSVDFATDEALRQYASYTDANIQATTGAIKVLFTTTAPAKEFHFFEVTYEERSDGFVFVERTLLYSTNDLTPEKPLVIRVLFPGEIPTRGISYLDENGVTQYFIVIVSGRDGSLLLIEF